MNPVGEQYFPEKPVGTRSIAEWSERFDPQAIGVDHLGMRVAGERAYGELLDFTTTVTWRPRYLSFLCWMLERAFVEAGGRRGATTEYTVDWTRYRQARKRGERVMAAASVLTDETALRIIGYNSVSRALQAAREQGMQLLLMSDANLASVPESFATYAGPLMRLGLLEVDPKFSRPTATRGLELAKAFARSLDADGGQALPLFSSEELPLKALQALGERCGLNQLSEAAKRFPEVAAEREALRETILDWESFQGGRGPSARRILSIGIILALHRLPPVSAEAPLELAHFRQATLLDGVLYRGASLPFSLPAVYAPVLASWRLYQAHAYVTYACEALLGLVLAQAQHFESQASAGMPLSRLTAVFLKNIRAGARAEATPPRLDSWWECSLEALMPRLQEVVVQGRSSRLTETELLENLWRTARSQEQADFKLWAHDAALMLLLSLARLKHLLVVHGSPAWLGDRDPARLPPECLVRDLEAACAGGQKVEEFLGGWLRGRIIAQHQRNALRKLAADPRKDTTRFELAGDRLLALEGHEPGTSNPRFSNAVLFLQDLGFLTAEKVARPTPAGEELLARIEREAT